jgi:hypothetical protein
MAEKEIKGCCIYSKTYSRDGNIPIPLLKSRKCCDYCNKKVVAAEVKEFHYKRMKP